MAEMGRIVINDYVDAALCALFVLVVVSMGVFGVRATLAGWRSGRPTAIETTPPPWRRPDPMAGKPKLREQIRLIGRRLGQCGCLMVGVPDYDTDVGHVAPAHRGEPPMTYKDFFRERQAARYGDGGTRGMRCC
jgi:uncharacterized short protein YbdD (DUF466 family)